MNPSEFTRARAQPRERMKPIAVTLHEHQRRPDRIPHVRVTLRAERWGVPLLPWERLYQGEERDGPHALAVTGAGTLVRARNDGGSLLVSRVANPGPDSDWGSWTALGPLEEGSGVALAARADEVLLVSIAEGGRDLTLRRSADGGATWATPRTLVREDTAVDCVALGIRSGDGDACAFYTQGSSVLRRLRRRDGRWDASGVDWNRGGEVSALTGVATMHDGADYRLLVSGRARPGGTKHVWSCLLGDGGFPADLWSALTAIAESDAASAREFGGPAIFRPGGADQRACFAARDSGAEMRSRVYTTHPPALTGGNPNGWSEPEPHEAASAHGLALATPDAHTAWGATPDGVWRARLAGTSEVTDWLVEASWRFSPFATRARVVLDDSAGDLPTVAPGGMVEIAPGYRSGAGGLPEYGLAIHAAVDRVTRESGEGRARVVLDCSGHWERLAAWRASQVWQSPAGEHSRGDLFRRLCAKAGIRVGGQVSEGWSDSRPAFAVSPGESGLSAARRLLGVSPVAVVSDGDGVAISRPGDDIQERYSPGDHPIAAVRLSEGAAPANWVRAQGPDHAADAHDFASIYRDGQRLRLVRSPDAGSEGTALEHAAAALDRERREQPAGLLVAPFHAGLELFDIISVTDARLALREQPCRVVELGMEYARRPGRRPRYDSVLGLAEPV